jgi:hypothetical protein
MADEVTLIHTAIIDAISPGKRHLKDALERLIDE